MTLNVSDFWGETLLCSQRCMQCQSAPLSQYYLEKEKQYINSVSYIKIKNIFLEILERTFAAPELTLPMKVKIKSVKHIKKTLERTITAPELTIFHSFKLDIYIESPMLTFVT